MHLEIESMPLFDQSSRYKKLHLLALDHQLDFNKKRSFKSLPLEATYLHLFKNKSFRKLRNVFSFQEQDLPGEHLLFDFLHTDSDFDPKRTTAVLFDSEALNLTRFYIRPKNVLRKIGGLFVAKDQSFGAYPKFCSRYHLAAFDWEDIKYTLKPEILEFLSKEKKWSIEGRGRYLLCYKKNKTQKPKKLLLFYEDALAICRWIVHSKSNDFV